MDAPRESRTGSCERGPILASCSTFLALPVQAVVGLVCGLDASVLTAGIATAAGSLGGLDFMEPLRLGAAAATGAVLAWVARQG